MNKKTIVQTRRLVAIGIGVVAVLIVLSAMRRHLAQPAHQDPSTVFKVLTYPSLLDHRDLKGFRYGSQKPVFRSLWYACTGLWTFLSWASLAYGISSVVFATQLKERKWKLILGFLIFGMMALIGHQINQVNWVAGFG